MAKVQKNTAPAAKTAGQKAAETKAAKKAAAAPEETVEETKPKAKPAKAAAEKPAPKAKPKAEEVEDDAADEAGDEGGEEADGEAPGNIGRKELAAALREDLTSSSGFAISQKVSEAVVKSLESVISNALAQGTEVVLPGFGKFKVNHVPGGPRRNPSNGETIEVAATWRPVFKVGKALKDAANSVREA